MSKIDLILIGNSGISISLILGVGKTSIMKAFKSITESFSSLLTSEKSDYYIPHVHKPTIGFHSF